MRELTVATSGLADADLVVTLGPYHPSTPGVLRLALVLDGDRIERAEPIVGHLHRGAEKLFEVRDYRQALALANRHDWLSAFGSELGIVLAVERMLGLPPPQRAVWARTLLAELTRVLSHLLFLGAFPVPGSDGSAARSAVRAREPLLDLLERATGGRMHVMANQVGGLRQDLPGGWTQATREVVAATRGRLADLSDAVLGHPSTDAATRGVGVISAEQVGQFGLSGSVARASGVGLDLRLDDPYLGYPELAADGVLRRVTRGAGDAQARLQVLAEQAVVALDLVDACLDRLDALPPGPINVKLPKVLRAPEGQVYAWTENPLGINGYYLVSRGEKTPWRLKLRTASFNNVQVLREVLPGCHLGDLAPVLGSLFFVVGDLDK